MRLKVPSAWRAAWRRSAFEDGMDAEMRFHLESRAADLIARGMAPDDARRMARLEFGGIEKQKDLARASAGLRAFDELRGDLRYALRVLARNRVFTAAAVTTLALGIGANAAIFNLIDALMLRSLRVSHPEQLWQISKIGSSGPPDESFSYPMIRAIDARQDLFVGAAGFGGATFIIGSGAAMQRVRGGYVSGAFYETLGLRPVAGRLLTRGDDEPDAPAVAVASYDFWQRQWAGSAAAVGQTLSVDGIAVMIVGVSPRGFSGANVGTVADLTLPVAALSQLAPHMAGLLGPGNSWLRVLSRLRPGISVEQASARLSAAWPQIAAESIDPRWPVTRKNSVLQTRPSLAPGGTGWTYLRGMYVKPLQVLMGAVALVLLIACANVASLMLARGNARRKEIAVRLAIGAGRARLMRQLLVESLLLALLGAAGALLLARVSSPVIVSLVANERNAMVFDLNPSWRVFAFTTAAAAITAILFGVVPAVQATAVSPAGSLKEDARTATPRSRLLPSLVAAQMALSLVLLIGAGLFVRTLRNLQALDAGFRSDGVLLVGLERRPEPVPATVLADVRRLPGVVSASMSTHTPLSGATWSEPAVPAGQPVPERDTAVFIGAAPSFFATLQIPLLAGREFSDTDTRQGPAVAIVNERYAQRYFGNGHPIGRRLSAVVRGEKRDLEIVGLARNANTSSLRAQPPPTVFVPYAQLTGNVPTNLEVRVSGRPADLVAPLAQLLQPLVAKAPIDVEPLAAQVEATMSQERLMAALASGFGVLALVLAAIGVYGLLAYGVARRTREIGIRMALGARRAAIIGLVLRSALYPLAAGILCGAPAAWLASRSIESMLFGLKAMDAAAIGIAIAVLVAVAQVAAYLPARRAARVDPLVALKCE